MHINNQYVCAWEQKKIILNIIKIILKIILNILKLLYIIYNKLRNITFILNIFNSVICKAMT